MVIPKPTTKVKRQPVDLTGRTLPAAVRLRAARVSQKTLDRYLVQIDMFKQWCRDRKLKLTKDNMDARLVKYMDWHYFHEDTEPNNCAYVVYGLQLLECSVPKHLFLPNSKEALASWRRLKPGSMRLPVPEEIVFDVAIHLASSNLLLGLLVLIQFDAYLRPSEALHLRVEHLIPPVGRRYSRWALVVHPADLGEKSKTGTSDDSVVLGDVADRSWMKHVALKLSKTNAGHLFPGIGLAEYERSMTRALDSLGYSSHILSPHIIRHSGASNDAVHHRRPLASIQKRGRWAAKKSVARYEKAALVQRQWKFAPSHRLQTIQDSPKRLARFLARLSG